jgi:hypothetical protein
LTVTIAAPGNGGTRATAKVEVNAFKVINKAIQELFDPVYGRMNATLAVELPYTSQANATTIPLAYVDTPVESLDAIKDGETQIWKITHNGVDSHPVHFHLMNVQLINRVDWAGVIKPPKPSEMGWKETITMSPLEDVYVAARAERPAVPFGLPTSRRMLDPSQAEDSTLAFTNLDPVTGQAPTFQRQLVGGINKDVDTTQYSNKLTDFDNEYVWHCHILGHEENDFMRPMIFHPDVVRPDAPTNVNQITNGVEWTDPTPFGDWDKDGIPTAGTKAKTVVVNSVGEKTLSTTTYDVKPTNNAKNEIGFKVLLTLKKTVTTTTPPVAPETVATVTTVETSVPGEVALVPANVTKWTGTPVAPSSTTKTALNGVITETSYAFVTGDSYRVVAYNAAGDSVDTSVTQKAIEAVALPTSTEPTVTKTAALTGVTQTYSASTGTTVTWDAVDGATSYTVTVGGVQKTVNSNSVDLAGALTNQVITIAAVDGASAGAKASAYNGIAAPVALTGTAGTSAKSITLTWANNPLNVNNGVTGLTLTWSLKGSNVVATKSFPPSSTGVTIIGLSGDKDYNVSLVANGVIGNSAAVTKMVLSSK